MYLSFKAEKAMSSISVNENRDINKFGRFWKIFRKKLAWGADISVQPEMLLI